MSTTESRKTIGEYRTTLGLILVNIGVFFFLRFFPLARDWLLMDPAVVWTRPWTLVSVFFAHELVIHVFMNMGLVYFFGKKLEEAQGGRFVVLVYVLSGLLGSLVTLPFAVFIQWSGPVVGASAAVFGIVGAYAGLNPQMEILKGKMIHWFAVLFIVNLVATIANPLSSIGGPAHGVGVLTGFILGFGAGRKPTPSRT